LPSDAKTPPSAPSGSPPPPRSPSEISSRHPCSLVFEQCGSSGKVSMIDLSLSSDEENFIADTSRDVEFTNKLFGDLNHDILGLPGDGKVIVLDDFDEEKEAQKEKTIGTKLMTTSAAVNPPSPTMLLCGRKAIIAMIRDLIKRLAMVMTTEVAPVSLRPPRRRPRC
jgi:hypothetical protein